MKPIYDEDPELSSDLEWMLRSGQASPPMLAELLVDEYYEALYLLALAYLHEEEPAHQAAEQAIGSALLHIYQFGNARSVRTWLFGLALPIYRRARRRRRIRLELDRTYRKLLRERPSPASSGGAGSENPDELAGQAAGPEDENGSAEFLQTLERLPLRSREAAWLYFLLGWPKEETAAVLRIPVQQVEDSILAGRAALQADYPFAADPVDPPVGGVDESVEGDRTGEVALDNALRSELRRRGLARFSPPDSEQLVQKVGRQVNLTGGWLFRLSQFKEAAFTALAIVVITLIIFASSRLLPGPPPVETPPSVESLVAEAEAEQAALEGKELRTYTVRAGDTVELIAGREGISPENLRKLNRMPPGETPRPGSRLLVEAPLDSLSLPSVTPLPPPEPLTVESDSQEIRDRLLERSRMWQTLWGDARIKLYGPPGYLGPAAEYRVQFWSHPQGALVLFGRPAGSLQEVLLVDAGTTYLAAPGADPASFEPVEDDRAILRHRRLLDRLAPLSQLDVPYPEFPDHDNRSFATAGREAVADRDALVVERYDEQGRLEARLWLEPVTGAILRQEQYGGPQMETLLWEYQLTAVEFDAGFPPALLSPQVPWRGGFARGSSGDPQPVGEPPAEVRWQLPDGRSSPALQPAPPGFDPASARLSFQFLYNSLDEVQDPVDRRAHLFAGDYYLGDVPFSDPWYLACDRSPDGRRFAYTSIYPAPGWQDDPLRWFSLNEPGRVVEEPLDAWPVAVAFAPDNRQLAVFALNPDGHETLPATETITGTQAVTTTLPAAAEAIPSPTPAAVDSESLGSLFLLDLAGERRQLLELDSARSLVWSPDGSALAFIGVRPEHGGLEHVIVLDAGTGEPIFEAPFDSGAFLESEDGWPGWDWGVEFPEETNGLGGCFLAP